MAFARLRRVLESEYSVNLRSDQALVNRVLAKINRRAQEFVQKGEPAPPTKNPTVVASIQAQPRWTLRAISLLHKIGTLTTPAWLNLSQLSASWATRRYFWAIPDGAGGPQEFRLSEDARRLDFHQKTLLSDEFGIGMAGLVMEQLFNAPFFVDVSVALDDPAVYQNVRQAGEAQPDYLMWGEDPQSTYFVVECKGCQTTSSESMNQLRRGLEQVPSLVFGTGGRAVMTLVVATNLGEDRTTVFVLDPPGNDPDDTDAPSSNEREKVSKRTGERTWEIPNAAEFERRTQLSQESELLKWARLFNQALERDSELSHRGSQVRLPDFEPQTRITDLGTYRGRSTPLFPELGHGSLSLFTGVEEELLARIVERSAAVRRVARAIQEQVTHQNLRETSPYRSLSRNGTCMIVEGIE